MKTTLLPLIATVFLAGAFSSASAQVTAYTSPASFNAASTGLTTYVFPVSDVGNGGASYTLGPLTFSDSNVFVFNDGSYGDGVVYLAAYSFTGAAETLSLSGATALSFTLATYYEAGSILVNVNGTDVTTLNLSGGAPITAFLGLTSVTPITSLSFTNVTVPGDEIDLTGFQVGSATVPEPSGGAMLVIGGGGLWLILRGPRRPRQSA